MVISHVCISVDELDGHVREAHGHRLLCIGMHINASKLVKRITLCILCMF